MLLSLHRYKKEKIELRLTNLTWFITLAYCIKSAIEGNLILFGNLFSPPASWIVELMTICTGDIRSGI